MNRTQKTRDNKLSSPPLGLVEACVGPSNTAATHMLESLAEGHYGRLWFNLRVQTMLLPDLLESDLGWVRLGTSRAKIKTVNDAG